MTVGDVQVVQSPEESHVKQFEGQFVHAPVEDTYWLEAQQWGGVKAVLAQFIQFIRLTQPLHLELHAKQELLLRYWPSGQQIPPKHEIEHADIDPHADEEDGQSTQLPLL